MNKTVATAKETIFYLAFTIYMLIKYLDFHFLSKEVGFGMQILFAFVILVYVKHVKKIPDSKKKTTIMFIMPLLAIVSMNMFVLIGVFLLSFSVFGQYNRTRVNRILKVVYGFSVTICIISVAYSGVFLLGASSDYDRYGPYELSPDNKHVITVNEVGTFNSTMKYEYRLENVYLNVLSKGSRVLLDSYNIYRFDIKWHSDTEVEIDDIIYNITNK